MKLWVLLPVAALALFAQDSAQIQSAFADSSLNVNSRYTIESVKVSGWKENSISNALRVRMNQAVGQKLDHARLEELADQIKKELHASKVDVKVVRGSMPDQVAVQFEIPPSNENGVDVKVVRFIVNSREGSTGEAVARANFHGNLLRASLISDADAQLERFSGIRIGYERRNVGTNRLALRFGFASYQAQFDQATVAGGDTYRNRQIFEPQATYTLAETLAVDFGVRISRYRLAAPVAKTESSNAVVSTLRYHQRWGSESEVAQDLSAAYGVVEATHILESDPAYIRHTVTAAYRAKHGHNSLDFSFLAGKISGIAPLFDRFVLGNATTLRGWSKFALDPFGGSHVVHGSINYAHRWLVAFYDAGAIWDRPQQREAKQSAGAGFKKDGFQAAVAFPLLTGHVNPVVYAGMNF